MSFRNNVLLLIVAALCIFLMAVDNGPSEHEAAVAVEAHAQAIARSVK